MQASGQANRNAHEHSRVEYIQQQNQPQHL